MRARGLPALFVGARGVRHIDTRDVRHDHLEVGALQRRAGVDEAGAEDLRDFRGLFLGSMGRELTGKKGFGQSAGKKDLMSWDWEVLGHFRDDLPGRAGGQDAVRRGRGFLAHPGHGFKAASGRRFGARARRHARSPRRQGLGRLPARSHALGVGQPVHRGRAAFFVSLKAQAAREPPVSRP